MVADDDIGSEDGVSDTEEYECRLPQTKTAPEISLKNFYWWKDPNGEWREQRGSWQPEGQWWRKTEEKPDANGVFKQKFRKVNVYRWKGWMDFHGFPYPSGNPEYNDECHACRERKGKDARRKKEDRESNQLVKEIEDKIKKLHHHEREP